MYYNGMNKTKLSQDKEKVTVGKIHVEHKDDGEGGIFLYAVVKVYVPIGPPGHSIMQMIRSGGIGGVDLDSSEEYYKILEDEEVEQLKEILAKLGVKA